MIERLAELESRALAELAAVADAEGLEKFRIKYLGGKGELKEAMGLIKDVPKEAKRDFGARANAAKAAVEGAFEERRASLAGSAQPQAVGVAGLDITEPPASAVPGGLGRQHVITQTIDELVEVFGRMGFAVATGPELEDEWHNFVALNIPESHPARDPNDNFYLDPKQFISGDGGGDSAKRAMKMLRSQTSTIQIRVMETQPPPIRVIATGRVYRPDEHDATHFSMFHQVEGLYIDKNVSMVDLKTTLIQFTRAMFGPDADVKLVPSYFPFTEPSAELYVKIELQGRMQWMEIGGCGMVDPAVLGHVGIDPEEWTGFAFGLGIERLAMRKYGIPDIRLLFENDVRFLRQF